VTVGLQVGSSMQTNESIDPVEDLTEEDGAIQAVPRVNGWTEWMDEEGSRKEKREGHAGQMKGGDKSDE